MPEGGQPRQHDQQEPPMTGQPLQAVPPSNAGPGVTATAHPGFFEKVGAALHHGEEEVKHAAQVLEGDAAKAREFYLEHAAGAHELAAVTLRLLQDADPESAALLEQVAARALPVAETAGKLLGAVLTAL
jgi:hypothetical protein